MAKKLIKSLFTSHFCVTPILGNGYIDENFSVLLMKVDSPIIYLLAVISLESDDANELDKLKEYSKYMESYLDILKNELSAYYCSNIICLHLLVDNITKVSTVDFVDKNEYFPNGNVHNIWWCVSVSEKRLYTGKNQPKNLLNISDLINKALNDTMSNEESINETSLKIIQDETVIETALQKKTEYASMTWIICILNVIIFLIMISTDNKDLYILTFANDSYNVKMLGEYYRLVSSMFLHADIFHLLSNSLYLCVFGRYVEVYFGKITFLLIYFMSGIAGSGLGVLGNNGFSIGASGAIFGLMSSILVLSYKRGKSVIGMNYSSILLLIVVVILSGFFDPNIDNLAHLGGFLAGGILSWIFIPRKA